MSKAMKRTMIGLVVLVLLGVFYGFLHGTTVQAYTPNDYTGSIYVHGKENSYQEFIEGNTINRPVLQEDIVIQATNYLSFVDSEFGEEVSITTIDGLEALYLPETGTVRYLVNIKESGFYNLKIKYYTISGRSSHILKGILINDEYQFQEASTFSLSRIWQDEFDVASKREPGKHDFKPQSLEKQVWNEQPIASTNGYYSGSYLFYLEEGANHIDLVGISEPVALHSITIFQEAEVMDYASYLKQHLEEGATYQGNGQIVDKVQGESSYEHSQSTLTPVASYNSYKIEPYAKFLTRYNTIGGQNWDVAGDWISWQVEVPTSGLYQITIKALQNYNRGLQANRRLMINGVVPFQECEAIKFNYKSDWQNITLGNGEEAYYFYLKEGINELKLQNTIGGYADSVRIVNQTISDCNWIYRKVIMRTGVTPSKYQSYQLYDSIEGLKETIERCIDRLGYAIDNVIRIAGERSSLISCLETTKDQLESFLKSEKNIQTGLNSLENNITSLGTWVMTISSQPLSIDYILVHGSNASIPKATINFFQRLGHEFTLLIGSYTADTSLKSSVETDGATITVWIMTGRDQANLLRSMIDQSFTMQNNINVEIKLVSSSVLLKAVLSGNGPDVAIGVSSSIPVNWGIRNAIVDMSQLEGFDEFVQNFYDSAVVPFTYNGATYALPDTEDFQIQFVRTDIFKELNLVDEKGKVVTPTTWDEVLDLLPTLQRQYLDYYLPNTRGALSPLLYSMICQYGGKLYLDNGKSSGLMMKESAEAFYDFVDFYKNYGFDVDASFTNRFRTGETPIGVSSFTLYNTLAVSAPEISGNWEFALLPGYHQDNQISYATASSASGTIITSSSKHIQESWAFVKWWLGENAQTDYAKGMESILGSAARYNTANKHAFAHLPWSAKDYKILEIQRSYARGIPTIPGDYIVGRYIDNAFRNILNENTNPSDALYNYHLKINAELERKQKELGLE